MSRSTNVQVALRIRPINETEKREGTSIVKVDEKGKAVHVKQKTFKGFDLVYGPASTQATIYRELVSNHVESALKGYNCTIFAYGQTGTGKTYTMEGGEGSAEKSWQVDPDTGIIPRSIQHIFERLNEQGAEEFVVRVSYVELYNEELFDLLAAESDDTTRLRMYEDPAKKGAIVISGAEEVPVRNRDDVYKLLKRGSEKRKTAETLMNQRSSRSHTVFTIFIVIRESTAAGEELVKQGKLHLVDLAGSENIGRSGADGKRAKEAGNINQSLLTLGRVITALTNNAPHIPYRESKLTRLLQDSLGGSTITTIIATLSPASTNYEESISTLEYAHRAKNIKNHPEVNQKVSRNHLFKEYASEIEKLRRDLRMAREKNGIFLSEESYQGMEQQIKEQVQHIEELNEKLEYTLERMKQFMEDMSMMDEHYRVAYARTQQLETKLSLRVSELEETKKELQETKEDLTAHQNALEQLRVYTNDLHRTANRIRATAVDANLDCDHLHDKLERTVAILVSNLNKASQLRASVDDHLPGVRESVDEAGTEIDAQAKEVKGHIECLFASSSEILPSIRDGCEKMKGEVEGTMEEIRGKENTTTLEIIKGNEECEGTIKELVEKTSSHLSTIQSISDEKTKKMEETIEKLRKDVEELQNENEHWKGEYKKIAYKLNEDSGRIEEKNNQNFAFMQKALSDMLATVLANNDELKSLTVDAFVGASSSLVSAIEHDENALRGAVDQMEESIDNISEVYKDGHEKITAEISSSSPLVSSIQTTVSESAKEQKQQITKHLTNFNQIVDKTKEQVAAGSAAQLEAVEKIEKEIGETTKNTRKTLDEQMIKNAESVKKTNTELTTIDEFVQNTVSSMAGEEKTGVTPERVNRTFAELKPVLLVKDLLEGTFEERRAARKSNWRVRESLLVSENIVLSPDSLAAKKRTKRLDSDEDTMSTAKSFGQDLTNQ